jgi:hypothetical protein
MALRTELRIRSGRASVTLRFLGSRQRWISARSPKLSLMALWSALAPSITNNSVLGRKPAFDEVGQERLARSHVLGRAFAQPQHVLLAAGVDADRGQHHVIGEAAGRRMFRNIEVHDPSSVMSKDEHDKEKPERRGRHSEHVNGGDAVCFVAQKAAPSRRRQACRCTMYLATVA